MFQAKGVSRARELHVDPWKPIFLHLFYFLGVLYKMKTNSPLSRKGGVKKLIKVIILLTTTIIGLSILLMPTIVQSDTGLLYNGEQIVGKLDFTDVVINDYVKQLKSQGYEEIRWVESPLKDMIKQQPYPLESLEKTIINQHIFSAKYYTIRLHNNDYYFKTAQEKDKFIKEINKYEKVKDTSIQIFKALRSETKADTLNKAIATAKKNYEARLAAAKKQRASNSYIKTNSNIAWDNPIVKYAIQFKGNPYVSGGTSLTKGADCSGFTQSIYKHFGVSIPRTPAAQARSGKHVSWDQLQPGDLVFYSGNGGKSVTHVALYIGGGQIIHASTPRGGIKLSPVNIMIKMTARRVI